MSNLDLYHRTTPDAAAAILREKRMTSKENDNGLFFSTHRDGENAGGYGSAVVHVRVPEHLAELDDEFPDGEQHYKVRAQHLQPHHFVGVRRVASFAVTFEHHDLGEGGHHRILAIDPSDKPVGMIEYKLGDGTLHPGTPSSRQPGVGDALHAEMTRRHPNHRVVTPGPEKPAQEPEPTAWYHGTTVPRVRQILPASQHHRHVTFPHDTDRDHAYATSSHEDAWNYAEKAWHAGDGSSGPPRVYQVHPKGHYEKDPIYDGDRRRGNNESDYRSKDGWDVVKELKMPRSMGKPGDWR